MRVGVRVGRCPPKYDAGQGGSVVDAGAARGSELLRPEPTMPATVIAERIEWPDSIRSCRVGWRAAAGVPAAGSGEPDQLCAGEPAPCDLLFPARSSCRTDWAGASRSRHAAGADKVLRRTRSGSSAMLIRTAARTFARARPQPGQIATNGAAGAPHGRRALTAPSRTERKPPSPATRRQPPSKPGFSPVTVGEHLDSPQPAAIWTGNQDHSVEPCPLPDALARPRQQARLADIRGNLIDRITEAEREGWLGEVEGLKVSLAGAENKLAQIDWRPRPPHQ